MIGLHRVRADITSIRRRWFDRRHGTKNGGPKSRAATAGAGPSRLLLGEAEPLLHLVTLGVQVLADEAGDQGALLVLPLLAEGLQAFELFDRQQHGYRACALLRHGAHPILEGGRSIPRCRHLSMAQCSTGQICGEMSIDVGGTYVHIQREPMRCRPVSVRSPILEVPASGPIFGPALWTPVPPSWGPWRGAAFWTLRVRSPRPSSGLPWTPIVATSMDQDRRMARGVVVHPPPVLRRQRELTFSDGLDGID